MRFFYYAIMILIMTACQSNQKHVDEFNRIEVGMVKSEVIAAAGSPHWSDRKHGQDRWIYYMNPREREDERIVYFENNKVVEKGQRNQTFFSAEEIDDMKSPPSHHKIHKRKFSDNELEKIIQEEIKKSDKQKPEKFEKI